MDKQKIHKLVQDRYGQIARTNTSCCCSSSCCGGGSAGTISAKIGYSAEELAAIPMSADLGLGCGNPIAMADLKAGQTVLDLGSGAGMDCFLAANNVGPTGRVIGVDMTDEMLDKARLNARTYGYTNVEFRKGQIEELPVEDNEIDVLISNCVINLSPDKPAVFREAFRALKPGGYMVISDIVLLQELPPALRDSAAAYVGCIAGAEMRQSYLEDISGAGFSSITVLQEVPYDIASLFSEESLEAFAEVTGASAEVLQAAGQSVVSIKVRAHKETAS